MDNKTFKELINKGELSLILMDGGADLTPSQMNKVKATAKALADERLEKMALELASAPGYREMMLNPLMSALLPKVFNTNPDRETKPVTEKSDKPADTNTTPKVSEEKKSVIKPEPSIPPTATEEDKDKDTSKSLEQVAIDLYSFLVVSRTDDVKQNLSDSKYRKGLDKTKEKRTKQLIGLFKVKTKKQAAPKKQTEKEVEAKGSETPKTGATPKTTGTTPTTTSTTNPTVSTVTRPSAISPAVKVGVGLGLAGAAGAAIGGAESGGNYDITFGDRLDKQKNIVRGQNMSPEQRFGKPLTELTLEEVDALGKERNRVSKNTSAMGKYQFMNTTLFGYKDKDGKFRQGLVQRLNLDMKTKFSPDVQEKLYALFREDNLSQLKRLGVPITPGYEYMAHYLGAGGAKAVYDRKNTDMTVRQALIDAGIKDPVDDVKKTNIELATLKASDFENILEGRLKKHGLNPHSENKTQTLTPQPIPTETKPAIPEKIKSSPNQSAPSITMLNKNNVVNHGGTQYNVSKSDQQDGAKILEKQYN